MHLVITHLTRMQPGFICVAGIEPDTGKQIRPVLGRCLTRDLLHVNGGAFEIGDSNFARSKTGGAKEFSGKTGVRRRADGRRGF